MRRNDSYGILSARPWACLLDVRCSLSAATSAASTGVTKYDKGIYLLVVASRMAVSRPLQRNLSNDSFLRVLFWNNDERLRAAFAAEAAAAKWLCVADSNDIAASILVGSGSLHSHESCESISIFHMDVWVVCI